MYKLSHGKKEQISNIKNDKNNIITNNELEKCSYNNGFKDSINGQRPDDLCFLIKDEKYRRGFRNGTSYLSKSEIKNSIEKSLKRKNDERNDLMKSGIRFGISPEILDEKSNDISEMKKEVSYLEHELRALENDANEY